MSGSLIDARFRRAFRWWLRHPRLYRLIGFRWLCWRYHRHGYGIPDPRPVPQEAIDLGRELAKKHDW